jgi:class 3 adenylate cyclase/tetratricopeptide (TPR) repeat protein
MAACPRCGEANPEHARFCLACGSPLGRSTAREMRKTVTIVFTDLIGSTPLGEQLDAETYRHVISRYFIEVSRVLEHHGGTVEKFIGDAVMAAFGIPILHEDDALRAVRAAADLREALAQLNQELEAQYGFQLGMRTGINTGEVVAGDPTEGHAFATGEAVALAQRLEAAASPGEILLGEKTYRLVRDAVLVEPLEPLELKGRSKPVKAWRLLGVVAGAPAVARRLDSPMIGRQDELARLRTVFEESVRDQTCRLVTVLGPAGIGKSRLMNELLADVRAEARVLLGRCLPYGEGITYWPLRDLVRDAAGRLSQDAIEELLQGEPEAERIAARVAGAIGIQETSASPEETMVAVRRLLEHLARQQPLIVAFDDLQWAEQTFVDLIEYLCGWARDAPLLIVCLARPDLLDRFPSWIGRGEAITLEPLSPLQAEELLEHLLGDTEVDADLLARISRAAEGNPLFVEQMLAMLTEDAPATADLTIPPTIHALLAARLDRLAPEERTLIERASVVGKEFWRSAVTELSPDTERESVGASLMVLARKELIEPARSSSELEDSFKFRHILIRDAAYLGIPKETRAELHERHAGWLGETSAERAGELDEIIGYHLEQAHGYREELGPVSEGAAALAARGGERLAAAGRRAARRGDLSAAASLISRAVRLLPLDDPSRPELLAELGSTLMRTGDFDRVGDVLDEASEAAAAIGDERLELRLTIERAFFRTFTEPEGSALDDSSVADQAIPRLEALGDDAGLARAWWLKSEPDVNACRWGARAKALERALEHARRAGGRAEIATMMFQHAQALYCGPTPVPEATARCRQYLAELSDDRLLEASITTVLAGLRAMEGGFDEARGMFAQARDVLDELGSRFRLATVSSILASEIEHLAGQPDEAVSILRRAYETVNEMGAMSAIATIAAFLADALALDGQTAEAEELSSFAQEHAPESDVVTQVLWRTARATSVPEGEALARAAVAIARETDYPAIETRALLCLADLLGPGEEQSARVAEARSIYEAKGNVAAVARLPAQSPAPS